MKKRAILGVSALFAAAVLPVANVFATDSALDYANSIGQINDADTINRVVEATYDGGYIVGGQTIGCEKYIVEHYMSNEPIDMEEPIGGVRSIGEGIVYVTLEECQAYYDSIKEEDMGGRASLKFIKEDLFDSFCGNDDWRIPLAGTKGEEDEDVEYAYRYVCIDYAAKFRQNGEREWLTLVNDSLTPVAVGETSSDYRMLVRSGRLYTFAKSGGDEGISTQINGPTPSAATFDDDGSLYVAGNGYVVKYNKNVQEVARLPESTSSEDYWTDNNIVMNDEGIYITHYKQNTESSKWDSEVVKISKDFETVTPIITPEDESSITVVSGDAEGNIMTIDCTKDNNTTNEEVTYSCSISSRDKEGNVIAEMDLNEESLSPKSNPFMEDFVIYDRASGTITKYDKNLEPVFVYTLQEGEVVNDIATLNDGSTVGVGASTASTDNYEVAGSQNGIQMRLGATKAGDSDQPGQPSNPGTLDNIHVFMASGAVVLIGAALLSKKMLGRR